MEIQRQLKKHGLEGSLIRVFKSAKEGKEICETLEYSIDLDPSINSYDIEQIRKICPKSVFVVADMTEEENYEDALLEQKD